MALAVKDMKRFLGKGEFRFHGHLLEGAIGHEPLLRDASINC